MNICIVCHGRRSGFRPFWPGLVQCGSCGHVMADVDISSLDFKKIYGESYFYGEEYEDYLHDRQALERHFQDRLKLIKKFQPSGDLIEIGCAYGFFLSVARRDYNVRGYDIAEGPTEYSRKNLGVDARCEDFINAHVEDETADIVVMWDTVEHLPRPDLTIRKAAKALRPGGFLMITTGDIGSVMARVRKSNWRLIHPPTHLHYFSRNNLTKLLTNEGLRVVKTRYVGVRRSVRFVFYRLFELGKKRPSRLYRIIADSWFGNISFVINTYDIILVVAQKPSAV